MKASELMIGDWVEMNLSPSVHKSYFKAQIVVSNLVSLENNYDFDAKPIPLTEEILKANFSQGAMDGFYYTNGMEIYVTEDGVDIYIRFGDSSLDYQCIYVHEFQHALRLCGFNELADNFKIG